MKLETERSERYGYGKFLPDCTTGFRKEAVPMSMLIEVWGDYACFSRPEMKTERVSYDIITPSAARVGGSDLLAPGHEVPY